MAIILRLDREMADRRMSLNELLQWVGVANVNLSKLKNGRVSAVRFSTLEAICEVLDCQPGDLLECKWDQTRVRPLRRPGFFAEYGRIPEKRLSFQRKLCYNM